MQFCNLRFSLLLIIVLFNCLAISAQVAGDECSDAADISSLLNGELNQSFFSDPQDNTDYTTSSLDPSQGWECFGEPDGNGAFPSLETTMWYRFTGNGNRYRITTNNVFCGGLLALTDGDSQMALYSGTCGNLIPEQCNEDAPTIDPNGPYPAEIDLITETGKEYILMVDAFKYLGNTSTGIFCLEIIKTSEMPSSTGQINVGIDLSIFPNPTNEIVSIQSYSFRLSDFKVNIIDCLGNTVKNVRKNISTEEILSLDIKDLEPGIYFLNLAGKQYSYTEKLIVR